jgi:hypothetical protein
MTLKLDCPAAFPNLAPMGLVLATSIVMALCLNNRGRLDEFGDDRSCVMQIIQK